MATGFLHDERYFWIELGNFLPLGPLAQPFPAMDSPDGKRRILNLARASGIMAHMVELAPREATEEELARIHTRDYIDLVKRLSAAYGGEVGDFTALCAGGYEICALAAGGCITAFDAVLAGEVENAFALVRPCGHHAEANRGRGFAVFSNVAVAVADARARGLAERVAVVDWDVHHGNGTQWSFYDEPDVLAISVHQDRLYPVDSGALSENGEGRGEGFNLNVPLPAGSGHGAYVAAMERVVVPALEAFRPDLIVVACGFDANAFDPLSHMICHSETYREMTRQVKAVADQVCGGRLVICQEGGYAPAYIPYCAMPVFETLSGRRSGVEDPMLDFAGNMGGHELLPHQEAAIAAAREVARRIG